MRFKTLILTALMLALSLVLSPSASAQTALNETTLSAAVATDSIRTIQVASATGFVAGNGVYVDREYMIITAVSGTNISVIRGANGTVGVPHASGVLVYQGSALAFGARTRSGSCTSTAERYLPQINVATGAIYTCPSAVGHWINLRNQIAVTCRTGVLATGSIDQSCFTADRPYLLVKINEVHAVAESAGTLTLVPRRQQSTEAPASGDSLVAAAIDMVGAGAVAQTVKTPALTATASLLLLATGDRLGLDFTDDVAGELAGVVVTFYLVAL